jgi:hypothetical protein
MLRINDPEPDCCSVHPLAGDEASMKSLFSHGRRKLMRLIRILPIVLLGFASSVALADDKNCSDLNSPQARQECLQRKYSSDVDCSKLDDLRARKECLDYKQDHGVDCSKLDSPKLRRECAEKKAK